VEEVSKVLARLDNRQERVWARIFMGMGQRTALGCDEALKLGKAEAVELFGGAVQYINDLHMDLG
jgi:hypothetical protein